MAHSYLPVDRDQLFLLPESMRDWLAEDHLVWFVLDVVERVDTSGFDVRHPNVGVGRRAYDPKMMLALLVYAYSEGVFSSRRIERLCRSDIAYRVICANRVPDHAAIARFRADQQDPIRLVFVEVLALCAAAGLTSLGTIAIDGTKIAGAGALRSSRGRASIRAELDRLGARVDELVGAAAAADADDDATFGDSRGDELPGELASAKGRIARLDAALAELARLEADAAGRAAKADAAADEGNRLRGRRPQQPHAAVARAAADVRALHIRADAAAKRRARLEADRAAQGRRLAGRRPKLIAEALAAAEAELAAAKAAAETARDPHRVNTTDPDSRIMHSPKGWLQGYNAQAAVDANQIVVACDVTAQANDLAQLIPMMDAAADNLQACSATITATTVLADAGYWSHTNATAPGPDRLIATLKDWKQRQAARAMGTTTGPPPPDASPLDAMEHRLRTPEGAAVYATRSHTVEPVFGHHKDIRRFRRFSRRGLPAVQSEWSLINTTHNLVKLWRHTNNPRLA